MNLSPTMSDIRTRPAARPSSAPRTSCALRWRRAAPRAARSAWCRRWATSTRATSRCCAPPASECDVVVMSLFVNPTQFGAGEDLDRYPRDEERDARLAAEAGVDFVYAPPVEEVYPEGFATAVEVDGPDRGPRRRPGAARPRPLPRRHHRRRQALQHGPARRRLLRPEGRPAAGRDPAHGARPRHPGPDRGAADRARGRRAGDELAQRLPRARGPASGRRRSRGRCAPPRAAPARSRWRTGSPRRARELEAAGIEPEYLEARDPDDLCPGRPASTAARCCSRSPPGSAARG